MDKKLLILFIAVIAFYLSQLPGFPVNWDEPWFYELSFWQAKLGYAKLQMWQIMDDPNTKQLVTHKLYIALLSLFHKLGLAGIYSFKFLSLFFCISCSLLIYRYIKQKLDKNAALFAMTLFFSISWTQMLGFSSRPEFMMLFFSLLAFFLAEKYYNSNKLSYIIYSAIFMGLAIATHLNALAIAVSIGLCLLILSPKKPGYIVFGTLSLLTASLYFWDIQTKADFQLFLHQFTYDPALKNSSNSWYSPILKILGEHRRFFNHGNEASLSLLVLFCYFSFYKSLWKKHQFLILFSFFNIAVFAAIARSHTPNYLTMHYLFFCFVVGFAYYQKSIKVPSLTWRRSFYGLFVLFLLLNLGTSYQYSQDSPKGHENNSELIAMIPANSKPMITANFVYDLIGKFPLTGERLGQLRNDGDPNYSVNFKTWHQQLLIRKSDFILIDKKYTAESHYFIFENQAQEKLRAKYWHILKATERYFVAKKINSPNLVPASKN